MNCLHTVIFFVVCKVILLRFHQYKDVKDLDSIILEGRWVTHNLDKKGKLPLILSTSVFYPCTFLSPGDFADKTCPKRSRRILHNYPQTSDKFNINKSLSLFCYVTIFLVHGYHQRYKFFFFNTFYIQTSPISYLVLSPLVVARSAHTTATTHIHCPHGAWVRGEGKIPTPPG